jgi:hypothetical protein
MPSGCRDSFVFMDPENSVLLFSLSTVIAMLTKSTKCINIEWLKSHAALYKIIIRFLKLVLRVQNAGICGITYRA